MSQPSTQGTLIVAHRGASQDAPENTLAAFRLAWAEKADAIEADFRLTNDGYVVCIHDETTKRTSGVNLSVANSKLAELKELDFGSWKDQGFSGERILTLQEVIAEVPTGKRILIELKTGAEIVAPMALILKESNLKPEQILVIAFDEESISESKRLLPDIKTHWLTKYDPGNKIGLWSPSARTIADTIKRTRADGLGSQACRTVLDEEFIGELNAKGVNEFHVWTVDDPADARFYQNLGAYGINTNRPAFIRSKLNKISSRDNR